MPKGFLKMKRVELAEIQAIVARKFSITTDQMLSRTRNQAVIFACQIAMYIARMHTAKSLPEIAASFNKTHAAVLYGITTASRQLKSVLKRNQALRQLYLVFWRTLKQLNQKGKRLRRSGENAKDTAMEIIVCCFLERDKDIYERTY